MCWKLGTSERLGRTEIDWPLLTIIILVSQLTYDQTLVLDGFALMWYRNAQHACTVKSALCKNMFYRKGMFSDLTHDVLASNEVKAARMCLEKRLLAKHSFYSL